MAIDLFFGDCLDYFSNMDKESVDAVVTDPPYGIGRKYENGKEATSNPKEYWEWFYPYYVKCMDVLRPGGFWAFWQSGTYHRYMWEWFGDDVRIYVAAKNFVQLRKTPINHGYDIVAMGYKYGSVLRPDHPKRNLDFFVANMAKLVSDPSRIERGHPSPKPLDQVNEIIDNFTLPGGIVIDPFMGSGTVGLSCVLLGRSFKGCEIVKNYFDMAEFRINEGIKSTIGV